ncbi:MAG: hypothetical protein IJR61_07640 [Clostridia bacterium]|nr:hypothetical protein [Clostridia bacterium]
MLKKVKIDVNFNKVVGTIKPLHGINDVPSAYFCFGEAEKYIRFPVEAGVPYCRLHDVCGRYGANVFVDVSNVFRNFDADENDSANYDFTFTDKLLELLTKSGIKPFYRLGETIENDFFVKRYRTYPPKDNLKWAKICEHIVRHYNYGWADGYKYGIEYWEIWNEPDNASTVDKNQMWGGTPEQFYELYSVAAHHLKTLFPEIKVGGYGSVGFYSIAQKALDPSANAEAGAAWFYVEYFDNFIRYIKSKDYHVPLDFFTWHSYSNVEQNLIYAEYVRRKLDENGFKATESNCNEWNPGTGNRCSLKDAAFVASNMLMWQNAPIDMAMYYNARISSDYAGWFDPLTCKPTKNFYVFKAFNGLYALKKQAFAATDEKEVFAVAATDGKEVALMISEYSGEDKEMVINSLDGLIVRSVFDYLRIFLDFLVDLLHGGHKRV